MAAGASSKSTTYCSCTFRTNYLGQYLNQFGNPTNVVGGHQRTLGSIFGYALKIEDCPEALKSQGKTIAGLVSFSGLPSDEILVQFGYLKRDQVTCSNVWTEGIWHFEEWHVRFEVNGDTTVCNVLMRRPPQ
jgi:hypothetical protein